jgi:hypothetical protein
VLGKRPIRQLDISLDEPVDISQFRKIQSDEPDEKSPSFDDFGGYLDIVDRAVELIEVPLKHHDKLIKINAKGIKGVLFTGPSVEHLKSDNAVLDGDHTVAESSVANAQDEADSLLPGHRSSETEVDESEISLADLEAELEEREGALSDAEVQQAANTVTNGVWAVAVDIEPGTYRAIDVGAGCYCGTYTSGTSQDDIISNGISRR